jgi:hypothetical protein
MHMEDLPVPVIGRAQFFSVVIGIFEQPEQRTNDLSVLKKADCVLLALMEQVGSTVGKGQLITARVELDGLFHEPAGSTKMANCVVRPESQMLARLRVYRVGLAEHCGEALGLGRSRFVGSGKAVEVGGGCGLESEVTVGEFGEVGWGCRNRGRHVGCGLGKG